MGNQNTTSLQEGDRRGVNEQPEKSSNQNRKLDNEAGDDRQLTPSVEKFDYHDLSGDEGGDRVIGSQHQESYAEEKNKFKDGNEQEEPNESVTVDKKDIQIGAPLPRAMEVKTQDLSSNIGKELSGLADSDDTDTRASKDKKNSAQINDAPWLDSGEEKASGCAISTEDSQYVKEENEDKMKMTASCHTIEQHNEPEVADSHKIAQVSMATSNSDDEEHSRNCSQMSTQDSQYVKEENEDKMKMTASCHTIEQHYEPEVVDSHKIAQVSMATSNSDNEEDSRNYSQMSSVEDFQTEEESMPKPTVKPSVNENSLADIAIQEERKDISVHEEDGVKTEIVAVKADTEKCHEDSSSHDERDSDQMEKANGHYAADDFVDAGEDLHKQLEGEETGETSKCELIVSTESESEIRSDPSVLKPEKNPEKNLETIIADNGIPEFIPESSKEDLKTINLVGVNAEEKEISEEVKTDRIAFVTIHPEAVQESRDGRNLDEPPVKAEETSQIQKAPSFNFDFLNLTALEESDQTPLLFQRKAPDFRSLSSPGDIRFSNPYGTMDTTGGEWFCKEKAINIVMKRNELPKSTIPFVRLEQGNDEHCPTNYQQEAEKNNRQNEPVMEQNLVDHGGREIAVTKGRETRDTSKTRASFPSFLSSCICCTGIGQLNAADP